MSRHNDEVYVLHMLDHARKAIALASGRKREDLDTDMALRYALIHLVCITGEASTHTSPETREQFGNVPWIRAKSMRNRLIHGYDKVDLNMLWETVTLDLPKLADTLKAVLGPRADHADGERGSS